MKILVVNSGSSSQKNSIYEIGNSLPEDPPDPVWQANVEWKENAAEIRIKTRGASAPKERSENAPRQKVLERLLRSLWEGDDRIVEKPSEICVVGHRIVHGGSKFYDPVIITDEVKRAIASASAIAPLHNRAELEAVELIEGLMGRIPQVAVFDTGFHQHLPPAAAIYPGPYEWFQRGIRRYGFHGINHQYCAGRAGHLLGKPLDKLRLVSCHLGNGCSLAAIDGGRSVDTTMGFTPLEGLMMGTRSGSVDPGILTYLMREDGMDAQQLDRLLNDESGLLGISGVSGDMRKVLEAMKSGNERAKLAFEIFIHRLRSCMGSMVAALGGVDAFIFTAGIGENSAAVREAACADFEFLHLKLDPAANNQSPVDRDIAARASSVRVLVIQAQEDWAVAGDCWKIYSTSRPASS